jgi:hypothetical protein
MRYRTEIVILSDRYVCVQLPDYMPEGRAFVTIEAEDAGVVDSQGAGESDADRLDIEWWDEFGGDRCKRVAPGDGE